METTMATTISSSAAEQITFAAKEKMVTALLLVLPPVYPAVMFYIIHKYSSIVNTTPDKIRPGSLVFRAECSVVRYTTSTFEPGGILGVLVEQVLLQLQSNASVT